MGAVSRLEDGGPSGPGTADICRPLGSPTCAGYGTADILSAPGTTDTSLALPAIG